MPRIRPEGGLSGTYQTPTIAGGSGMWTMRDLDRNRRIGSWPSDAAGADPYFSYNALLIHADGVSGANNTTIKYSSNALTLPFNDTYAYSFPGTLGYKTPANGNFTLTGDFTMEMYVYFSGSPTDVALFNNFTSANGSTEFAIEISAANKFAVFLNGLSSVRITGTTTVTTGVWYHVALVRSAGVSKLYVNGVQEGSSYSFAGTIGTGNPYYIAQYNNASRLTGSISNFRVTNTAVYTATFTPPTSTLTAISGTQLLVATTSTFIDSSPNALTLTLVGTGSLTLESGFLTNTGSPGQGTFTPFSQPDGYWSNYFDGNGDFHTLPFSTSYDMPGDFTVEAWIYRNYNTSTFEVIGGRWGGVGSNIWLLNLSGSGTSLQFQYNGTSFSGSYTFAFNQWYHVAVTRSGSDVRLFVNGTQVGVTTTITYNFTHATRTLVIGRNAGSTDGTQDWEGYISNFRVVVGTCLYTSTFTPPTSPLTAIANTVLLTCQSNYYKDNSSINAVVTPAGNIQTVPFSPFAPSNKYSTATNGGGLAFSGAEYSRITSATTGLGLGTGDFTIEFWAYFNSVASGGIVDLRTSGGAGSQTKPTLYISAAGSFSYYVAGANRITQTSVVAGQWYHIALVRSSGVTRLYFNGIQNGTSYTDANDYGASSQFTVGTVGDAPGSLNTYYNGYISNVRVKKSALYSTSFTPPTQPFTYDSNTALLMTSIDAVIIDSSAKHTLIPSGTITVSNTAKYGNGSISFNGSSYIRNSNNNVLFAFSRGDFTIEMWAYLNSTGNQTFYDSRPQGTSSTSNYIQLGYITGSLIYATAGVTAISGGALNTGQWDHIAVCRSGSSTRLFVNGVQVGSTYSDTQSYLVGAGRPIIGADGFNPAANFLNGYIDEFRVTKYALYTSNFTPPIAAPADR